MTFRQAALPFLRKFLAPLDRDFQAARVGGV